MVTTCCHPDPDHSAAAPRAVRAERADPAAHGGDGRARRLHLAVQRDGPAGDLAAAALDARGSAGGRAAHRGVRARGRAARAWPRSSRRRGPGRGGCRASTRKPRRADPGVEPRVLQVSGRTELAPSPAGAEARARVTVTEESFSRVRGEAPRARGAHRLPPAGRRCRRGRGRGAERVPARVSAGSRSFAATRPSTPGSIRSWCARCNRQRRWRGCARC